MRIGSFRLPGETRARVGRFHDDHVADLSEVFASILDVMDTWSNESRSASETQAPGIPLADVQILSPIPAPSRAFGVGRNYRDHGSDRELNPAAKPESVPFFSKATTSITGPFDPVPIDEQIASDWDYEGELAVVIGSAGIHIPPERALEHVFGYAIANDITPRALQRSYGGQWFKSKSIDRTCPLGPWIVTSDDLLDPQDLTLETLVNDELRQSESTSSMMVPVSSLVAELSRGMTLLPGDIIITGTPSGTGMDREPVAFLSVGDEVVVRIEQIGEIRNRVVASARSGTTSTPSSLQDVV